MFLILAAKIVYLIGLGPNYLARNSGLASTQTLALGSVLPQFCIAELSFESG